MVGKKGFFELKTCTVSGLKSQFDKWHLFRAPTGGGSADKRSLLGSLLSHFGGVPCKSLLSHVEQL